MNELEIECLRQRIEALEKLTATQGQLLNILTTGYRDAFIQAIAVTEDAKAWPYDRSALAKRRAEMRRVPA